MKLLNKKIRNLSVLLTATLVVSLNAGCEKFLDTERQGTYTADNYPYPEGTGPYDLFLNAAYNTLRNYHYTADAFMVITSIRSDDADKGSTPADGGADVISMDNFPVMPSSGRANGLWVAYYTMINRCNTVLDEIANNEDIVATPEAKVQAEAEAKFMRAYSYFVLVRAFGRVPKIESVLQANDSNVPQSSPEEIYALIESDLRFAAANLPPNWDPSLVGKITSGAANGILAKVYLTQQKWGEAMSTASLVMNSGQYDLSTPYAQIFGESGENSKESVFEIQATASAAITQANGVQYASIQGVRGTGEWNRGWGWNMPSAQLEAAYEPNDPRRERTILYTSTADQPGYTIYGELTPTGLPNPKYNQKVLASPSYIARINNRGGWWMNVRILRYADVVLMFAEAANEVGGEANILAARDALNSVRERARAGDNSILPDVTTEDQDELRQAIRHERRIELAMEHDRFFDIVRWGISQEVMDAAGKTNFSASRDNLLPIPQTQIDLSNGLLTPNPGY